VVRQYNLFVYEQKLYAHRPWSEIREEQWKCFVQRL
jgi:hypothetical protein